MTKHKCVSLWNVYFSNGDDRQLNNCIRLSDNADRGGMGGGSLHWATDAEWHSTRFECGLYWSRSNYRTNRERHNTMGGAGKHSRKFYFPYIFRNVLPVRAELAGSRGKNWSVSTVLTWRSANSAFKRSISMVKLALHQTEYFCFKMWRFRRIYDVRGYKCKPQFKGYAIY